MIKIIVFCLAYVVAAYLASRMAVRNIVARRAELKGRDSEYLEYEIAMQSQIDMSDGYRDSWVHRFEFLTGVFTGIIVILAWPIVVPIVLNLNDEWVNKICDKFGWG